MVLILFILAGVVACRGVSMADRSVHGVETMKIYDYDDYDECRRMDRNFVYCTAKAHLLPSVDSLLWGNMQNYSTHPRHFDRRTIEVGSCVPLCQNAFVSTMHNVTAVLQRCIERKMWSQYGMNSTITVMSCTTAEDGVAKDGDHLDLAQIMFVCCALGGIVLVAFATLYDKKASTCVPEKSSPVTSIIVQSFSLSRNLPKLVDRDNNSGINLRHLDGIRALTMMIILLSHCSIPLIRMPLRNIDELEAQFDQAWFPIAMAGNTYTVQIFFVIGGLLLAVNVLEQTKNTSHLGWSYFLDRVKIRLIRILPLYLFVILFHASWYPRLHEGPIGDRFKDHCASNWWTNVIFLNNYIRSSEPCIQFAWYLGTDFQLYLLGTMLMMLMRMPKLVKPIALCMVASAFVIPMIVIYKYHLDATVMMILRYILQEIRTLPYYIKMYIPFETNAGNYFFGMIAGMLYCKFKSHPAAINVLKLNYILPASAAFFLLMNGLTVTLPQDHLKEPSVGLALYGSLLKSAWGIFPSVLLLRMAFQKTPSMLLSTLQHPVFLVGSKLSYSVYLVQYGVIYAVYKHITYPLTYDSFTILLFTAAIVNITFFIALGLHLIVEVPCYTFLNRIFISSRPINRT